MNTSICEVEVSLFISFHFFVIGMNYRSHVCIICKLKKNKDTYTQTKMQNEYNTVLWKTKKKTIVTFYMGVIDEIFCTK